MCGLTVQPSASLSLSLTIIIIFVFRLPFFPSLPLDYLFVSFPFPAHITQGLSLARLSVASSRVSPLPLRRFSSSIAPTTPPISLFSQHFLPSSFHLQTCHSKHYLSPSFCPGLHIIVSSPLITESNSTISYIARSVGRPGFEVF